MINSPTIEKIYDFYNSNVRDAISGVQATTNEIPMEFLLEIYCAFDDLKLFFIEGNDDAKISDEVMGHLKRAALDCYKTYLLLLNEEIIRLEENYDLTILDNGKYYPKFLSKKDEIYKMATKARSLPPNTSTEQEFELWKAIYNHIYSFRKEMISECQNNLQWVKKESKSRKRKATFRNIVIGFISGILSGACLMFLFG